MNKRNEKEQILDAGWYENARKTGKWLPSSREIGNRFKSARGDRPRAEMQRISGISDSVIIRTEDAIQLPNIQLAAYYGIAEDVSLDALLLGKSSTDLLAHPGKKGLDPKQQLELELLALGLPENEKLRLASRLLASCVN